MAQQTAVEWYAIEETNLTIDYTQGKLNELEYALKRLDILQQAKQMEKEQIVKAFDDGCEDENRIGIEYYQETYENINKQ